MSSEIILFSGIYLIGVSITGGEPMLYPEKVNKLINLITSIYEENSN